MIEESLGEFIPGYLYGNKNQLECQVNGFLQVLIPQYLPVHELEKHKQI